MEKKNITSISSISPFDKESFKKGICICCDNIKDNIDDIVKRLLDNCCDCSISIIIKPGEPIVYVEEHTHYANTLANKK